MEFKNPPSDSRHGYCIMMLTARDVSAGIKDKGLTRIAQIKGQYDHNNALESMIPIHIDEVKLNRNSTVH